MGVSGLTGYKVANFAKKSFTTFGTYNFRRPDISQIETIQVDVTSKEKIQNISSLMNNNHKKKKHRHQKKKHRHQKKEYRHQKLSKM